MRHTILTCDRCKKEVDCLFTASFQTYLPIELCQDCIKEVMDFAKQDIPKGDTK